MMREKTLPFIYGGLVFLLSACAAAANGGMAEKEPAGVAKFAGDPRLGEQVDRMCFASNIDSFSQNTRDTVVLEMSPGKDFLVETSSCFDLDRAQSVAIDAHSSCVTRGDRLLVSDSVFSASSSTGAGPNRCFIKAIYAWDEKALDAAGIE
ncbi:MAG: hypothetical protein CMK09_07845 [Ponticaulis sp.]|nr:hypothetical protein [Ponticaulis sp.]|tara:strand:- start:26343 stop:26795 length:453 start_codon:yes stop_codon:yes gene_type:complete